MSKVLENKLKQELKEIAISLGLPAKTNNTKGQLLEMIKDHFLEHEHFSEDSRYAAFFPIAESETVVIAVEELASEDEDNGKTDTGKNVGDEAEDEEDADYVPSADLTTKIADPLIDLQEQLVSYLYKTTDKLGITATKYSDCVRSHLSEVVNLTMAQIGLEFLIFWKEFIPLIRLDEIEAFHNVRFNPEFVGDLKVVDFTEFFTLKSVYILSSWATLSILLPLVLSYYVNFTTRHGKRSYTFDPFTFNVFRFFLFLAGLQRIVFNFGDLTLLDSFETCELANYGILALNNFGQFLGTLGGLPSASSAGLILITLYSQFSS
ncbi:hypothetical protein BABINDRAFT_158958 [Babjeviella inositovora NRRL Y-12698]|uniref:Uncharacterized protein n=1 Tax=Babjeviella inositovora NRRL Y-12698 TaxID=984486 RepID=A0A1E3QXD8_9ASCO|nr:uncharacterized protein BABINDRAFT_158958 [Babjeviella inositovora NRRL Y-12698]ODQ82338.1 hypothetical protein BABINDRAFT_158958 [Babjeviella inositovora NRRL Y-12698]